MGSHGMAHRDRIDDEASYKAQGLRQQSREMELTENVFSQTSYEVGKDSGIVHRHDCPLVYYEGDNEGIGHHVSYSDALAYAVG